MKAKTKTIISTVIITLSIVVLIIAVSNYIAVGELI